METERLLINQELCKRIICGDKIIKWKRGWQLMEVKVIAEMKSDAKRFIYVSFFGIKDPWGWIFVKEWIQWTNCELSSRFIKNRINFKENKIDDWSIIFYSDTIEEIQDGMIMMNEVIIIHESDDKLVENWHFWRLIIMIMDEMRILQELLLIERHEVIFLDFEINEMIIMNQAGSWWTKMNQHQWIRIIIDKDQLFNKSSFVKMNNCWSRYTDIDEDGWLKMDQD